jgi:hypothetical protein
MLVIAFTLERAEDKRRIALDTDKLAAPSTPQPHASIILHRARLAPWRGFRILGGRGLQFRVRRRSARRNSMDAEQLAGVEAQNEIVISILDASCACANGPTGISIDRVQERAS